MVYLLLSQAGVELQAAQLSHKFPVAIRTLPFVIDQMLLCRIVWMESTIRKFDLRLNC